MSLSKAQKNIALTCKVLDLPTAQQLCKGQWLISIDGIFIGFDYCERNDELQISHQLKSSLNSELPEFDLNKCRQFSQKYLKRQMQWFECDIKGGKIALCSRIDLSDNSDFTLAIELPIFTKICLDWQIFAKSTPLHIMSYSQRHRANTSVFSTVKCPSLRAVALCDLQTADKIGISHL